MKNSGWAAENIAFGMGGALLQQVHRDTQKFAFKCSAITRNDVVEEVYKQPITDAGKHSKRGKLALIRNSEGILTTVPATENMDSLLQPVFENGSVLRTFSLSEIRQRAGL